MFHLWYILTIAILFSIGYIIGYKVGIRKLRSILEEERHEYRKNKTVETVAREREGQVG